MGSGCWGVAGGVVAGRMANLKSDQLHSQPNFLSAKSFLLTRLGTFFPNLVSLLSLIVLLSHPVVGSSKTDLQTIYARSLNNQAREFSTTKSIFGKSKVTPSLLPLLCCCFSAAASLLLLPCCRFSAAASPPFRQCPYMYMEVAYAFTYPYCSSDINNIK